MSAMTAEMGLLAACPFCGDKDDFSPSLSPIQRYAEPGDPATGKQVNLAAGLIHAGWLVECDKCAGCGPSADTEAEAIAAWNRRARPVAPASAVEALREKIARILCTQAGCDPDGGPRRGYGWMNYAANAGEVIAALTAQAHPAGDEASIRHDERKKIIAQGCIHTRKALESGNYDRPDLSQWQHDQSEYFDPTILEIVGEYAVWRDAKEATHPRPDEAQAQIGELGIEPHDEADYAELHRLYNFADDDSRQFTRWNMLVAIKHGRSLAHPAPASDAGEAKLRDEQRAAILYAARLLDYMAGQGAGMTPPGEETLWADDACIGIMKAFGFEDADTFEAGLRAALSTTGTSQGERA